MRLPAPKGMFRGGMLLVQKSEKGTPKIPYKIVKRLFFPAPSEIFHGGTVVEWGIPCKFGAPY